MAILGDSKITTLEIGKKDNTTLVLTVNGEVSLLGKITTTSTALVTNLNADKVDGKDVEETLSSSNTKIPTSKAVYDSTLGNIKIGTVSTVTGNAEVTATTTNRVTTLNFKIPKGESTYEVDLSPDSVVLSADSAGKVSTSQFGEVSRLIIYYGSTKEDLTSWTLSCTPPTGVTAAISAAGVISISAATDSFNSGLLSVTAKKGSNTFTTQLRVTKVKDGAKGATGATGETGAQGEQGYSMLFAGNNPTILFDNRTEEVINNLIANKSLLTYIPLNNADTRAVLKVGDILLVGVQTIDTNRLTYLMVKVTAKVMQGMGAEGNVFGQTTGLNGAKGDTGEKGPQGEKGDKGDTGATGPQGDIGPQGPQGEKGDKGATGSPGKDGTNGKDGKGIKSSVVTFQAGSSQKDKPTGTWSTAIPATSETLPYLWTRTVITYTDDTTSEIYTVGVGLNGTHVGGRNLIRGTADQRSGDCGVIKWDNSYFNNDIKYGKADTFKSSQPWEGCYYDFYSLYKRENLKVGDVVTFSIRVLANFTPKTAVLMTLYNVGSTQDGQNNVSITLGTKTLEPNRWYTYSATWAITQANLDIVQGDASIINYPRAEVDYYDPDVYAEHEIRNFGEGNYIYIGGMKLEKGNIATDWTPAPEDEFTPSAHNHDDRYYTEAEITKSVTTGQLIAGKVLPRGEASDIGDSLQAFKNGYIETLDTTTVNAGSIQPKTASANIGSVSQKFNEIHANKVNADVNGTATRSLTAGDGTLTIVPCIDNELNFGGTSHSNPLYICYRSVDNRPAFDTIVFGKDSGTMTLKAGAVWGAVFN